MFAQKTLPAALLLFALAACDGEGVKETLGLSHEAPDEFTVVSRPPLSVPKEFYLTPPTHGDAGEFGREASGLAREKLTGKPIGAEDMSLEEAQRGLADTATPVVQTNDIGTPGESALLQKAGAAEADPEIRGKLYQETGAQAPAERGLLEKLRGDAKAEPVVDAKAEAARLRANKDAGKPLNEGTIKTDDPKKKSVLERVLE